MAWKVRVVASNETVCAKPGVLTQLFSCPAQHLPSWPVRPVANINTERILQTAMVPTEHWEGTMVLQV